MPSYGGAHGPDGSKKSGDQGQGSRDRGGGQTGGAKGQGGSGFGGAKFGRGKQTTSSSTAADHLVAMGKVRAPSIPGTGVAQGNYPTQDDAYTDYAKAVGKYANRGFPDKALDFLGGGFYDPKEPMAGNPRSFAGGDFHSASNPGSIMGALLGGFGGGIGSLVGKLAGPAYTKAGLPEVWHGGYDQPDLRPGPLGNTNTEMGGTMADIGGGHTYSNDKGPGLASASGSGGIGGNTGNGMMGSFRPPQAVSITPAKARAQAMGPSNAMAIPDWWRTPY